MLPYIFLLTTELYGAPGRKAITLQESLPVNVGEKHSQSMGKIRPGTPVLTLYPARPTH